MKALKSLFLGVITAVIAVLGIALFLPEHYSVEEEVFIHAPQKVVFEQINTFPHWLNWAFAGNDSTNAPSVDFSGPMDGEGAVYRWAQNGHKGKAEIIYSRPFEQIQVKTSLDNGAFSTQTNFLLEKMEGGTLLHWQESGNVGYRLQARLLIALGVVQRGIASKYEVALHALKVYCETPTWEE